MADYALVSYTQQGEKVTIENGYTILPTGVKYRGATIGCGISKCG